MKMILTLNAFSGRVVLLFWLSMPRYGDGMGMEREMGMGIVMEIGKMAVSVFMIFVIGNH